MCQHFDLMLSNRRNTLVVKGLSYFNICNISYCLFSVFLFSLVFSLASISDTYFEFKKETQLAFHCVIYEFPAIQIAVYI
jgi:hypothetical protein